MTPAFTNLGDLIRRDRDMGKLAIIDLGGEGERRFTYADLDAMARGVARALTVVFGIRTPAEAPLGDIAQHPASRDRGQLLIVADQAVSNAGLNVARYFRRARLLDGSVAIWLARQTRPGSGPGSSGLLFDKVSGPQPQ